jgi:DNA-directed RNA polymerase subunit RPC12/RpoP
MIYKCPNCNGALEYNPITDRMECEFCGEGFILAEIEAAQERKEHTYNQQTGSQKVIIDGEGSHEFHTSADAVHPDTIVQNEEQEVDFLANVETMECNIYTCTSCGAELAISETEAATFCAYCGQPTVVFSRVSKELKPQSIVLFRIDKEQAIAGIREKLNKSFLVL